MKIFVRKAICRKDYHHLHLILEHDLLDWKKKEMRRKRERFFWNFSNLTKVKKYLYLFFDIEQATEP